MLRRRSSRLWKWDKDGQTPLSTAVLAACKGLDDMFDMSKNAISMDDETTVRQLVRDGADLEQVVAGCLKNKYIGRLSMYDTPLLVAVRRQNLSMVRLLVELGAKPGAVGRGGKTPLILATRLWQLEIMEYLLQECVVDVNYVDPRGFTALHHACETANSDDPRVVELLLRYGYGANINVRCQSGKLPIECLPYGPNTPIRHRMDTIANIIRAEEIRLRDHGFKRDRNTIPGTEEYEAAKRPRVEHEAAAPDESDDDDDDDDDDEYDDYDKN